MKKLAVIALISMCAAAPALAQTGKTAPAKPVAPVAEATEPAAVEITDATPLDVIVQEAPDQDRAKMLRRCAGPPPKLAKEIAALKPASEPSITGPESGGG
jgi:hypothetical protein